jgi:hypothetical protein
MVATPMFTPVTCGCDDGAVAPPAMNTLVGLTRTVVDLLLVSVRVTPPDGAGVPSLTGKATVWPRGVVTTGSVMDPGAITVTFTVLSVMPGALTRNTVDPAPAPVTGTMTLVPPEGIVALDGTTAMAGLSDRVANVNAAGAGADSTNVMFWVTPRVMVVLAGPNSDAVTRTLCVSPDSPKAEAVMFALPKFTPVTCG